MCCLETEFTGKIEHTQCFAKIQASFLAMYRSWITTIRNKHIHMKN